MTDSTSFAAGSAPWLDRLGNLRNVVRQEVVTRQLAAHLPGGSGGRAVDVGAGQGTQAIRLAHAGFEVTAVEPEEPMLEACRAAVAAEPAEVRARIHVRPGRLGALPDEVGAGGYDVVLCQGVLMYLDSAQQAVAELAALVAPGGVLSLLTRNADGMAWRPASRHDWLGALAMLDEVDRARREGRTPTYRNEIGVTARADRPEELTALLRSAGLEVEASYGVRLASDSVPVDEPFPSDPEQGRALLDLEERLGRTDPYRRLATLVHLVARR